MVGSDGWSHDQRQTVHELRGDIQGARETAYSWGAVFSHACAMFPRITDPQSTVSMSELGQSLVSVAQNGCTSLPLSVSQYLSLSNGSAVLSLFLSFSLSLSVFVCVYVCARVHGSVYDGMCLCAYHTLSLYAGVIVHVAA